MLISDLIKQAPRPFFSLEFFPPQDEAQIAAFLEEARALKAMNPLFVSVTYGAGGSRQANTLELACTLKNKLGFEPMTHLTCVGSKRTAISSYLERLQAEGIENILALRGDAPKRLRQEDPEYDWASGDFQHASDLVEFVKGGFPEFCVGVAAYPSPHPESESHEQDRFYTKFKVEAGGCFLLTQMFFDVDEYVRLVKDLRALGVDKPVIPGVMPVQSLESLKRIMSMCGARIPEEFSKALTAAHAAGGQQAVREQGIKYAVKQVRELVKAGAPGVHLYTLNKSETCLRIAKMLETL